MISPPRIGANVAYPVQFFTPFQPLAVTGATSGAVLVCDMLQGRIVQELDHGALISHPEFYFTNAHGAF